jgi:hypothetical protein
MREIAHGILTEARQTRQNYQVTGTDFDKIKANMYSIFECYAHGLITWDQVKTRFKQSIREYVSLYKGTKYLQEEIKIMRQEYKNVLQNYKPALDAYRVVSEQKLTATLISKKNLSESVAQQHSNAYYNNRLLSENDLTDTTRLTWKRVLEAYPNLTAKDEQRIRMLTIFEGPTINTTQMITTVVQEEPTSISGPMQTSMRPKRRPVDLQDPGFEFNPNFGHRDQPDHPENRGLTKSTALSTSPRPRLRPDNLARSTAINRAIRSAMGEGYKVLPPMDREKYQERPGLEGPFSTLSGKVVYYDPKEGSYYDPDTDMYLSYDEFKELDNDYSGMKNDRQMKEAKEKGMWAVEAIGYSVNGEKPGYWYKTGMTEAEARKRHAALLNSGKWAMVRIWDRSWGASPGEWEPANDTRMGTITVKTDAERKKRAQMYRDKKAKVDEAAYEKDMDHDKPFAKRKAMKNEESKLDEAVTLDYSRYMRSHGKKPRDTGGAGLWMFTTTDYGDPGEDDTFEFSGSFADAKRAAAKWAKSQGADRVYVMEAMSDAEVDAFHRDLDKIVHKHIGHGSHEKSKVKENNSGTYARVSYNYSEDWASIDIFKDGKQIDSWNDYFHSNETGNPLVAKFVEMAKKNGIDPTGMPIVDEEGNRGMFDGKTFKWNSIDERAMTKKEKSKEKRLKDKYDDSGMKQSMKDQYGDRWEEVYYATIRKKAMEQFNEMTSAGAIAAVAQPLGKMQRRKKTNESEMMTEEQFDEAAGEKDACYHKVKSRYKVWPSAYASGALAKCRKVGAKNWGNKSEK